MLARHLFPQKTQNFPQNQLTLRLSLQNLRPPRSPWLMKFQSKVQGGKSKNLEACPFPVGRSADPRWLLTCFSVGDPISPHFFNFFNCFSNNNLILSSCLPSNFVVGGLKKLRVLVSLWLIFNQNRSYLDTKNG